MRIHWASWFPAVAACLVCGGSVGAVPEYVAIAPDELLSVAQDLVTHRETTTPNCYEVVEGVVIATSVIEQTGDGNGVLDALELEAWLCDYLVSNGGVRFVLLAGDDTHIPEWPGPDFDFGYLECAPAECSIGRLPIATPAEGNAMVQKIITHDTATWFFDPDSDWRNDVVLLTNDYSYGGGAGSDGAALARAMAQTLYQDVLGGGMAHPACSERSVSLFSNDVAPNFSDYDIREQAAVDAIGSGVGLIVASGTGASSTEFVSFFSESHNFDPAVLENEDRPAVVLAMSCLMGSSIGASGPLRRLLVEPNRGALAAIAEANEFSPSVGSLFMKELVRAMTNNPGCQGSATIGEILSRVRHELLQIGIDHESVRSVRLLGDPALRLPVPGPFVQISGVDVSPESGLMDQFVRFEVQLQDPAYPSPADVTRYDYYWTRDSGLFSNGLDELAELDGDNSIVVGCSRDAEGQCLPGTVRFTVSAWEQGADCNKNVYEFEYEWVPVEDGGGCPIIDHKVSGSWAEVNSILSERAYAASIPDSVLVTDDVWFVNPVPASPMFDVRVRESIEGEATYLDYVELLVFDYPVGAKLAVRGNSEAVLADQVVTCSGAELSLGVEVGGELAVMGDSSIVVVTAGDTLTVWFEDDAAGTRDGMVQVWARMKPERYVAALPDPQHGLRFFGGDGIQIGEPLFPRQRWSASLADSVVVQRGDGVSDTVRLSIGELHQIDCIELLDFVEASPDVGQVKYLSMATHSDSGAVTTALEAADGSVVRLEYGQSIELRFPYGHLEAGYQRDVGLRVVGTYHVVADSLGGVPGLAAGGPWGLHRVAPNPFSGIASVWFRVRSGSQGALGVYDVSGRLVRQLWNGNEDRGLATVAWDGRDGRGKRVSSGVYFLRLEQGVDRHVRKLVVLR